MSVSASVCWSLGGDEASRVHPAAAVESDSGSEPSGAGAADAERAAPGQSGSGFPPRGPLKYISVNR